MSTTTPQDNKPAQQQQIVQAQQWSAPLPPPDALEYYERIKPGAADRILCMAEREQQHRHGLEGKAVAANIAGATRGQKLGAAIIFAAIGGAVAIVWLHGPWQAAVALVGVPLVGVVRDLVRGHSKE